MAVHLEMNHPNEWFASNDGSLVKAYLSRITRLTGGPRTGVIITAKRCTPNCRQIPMKTFLKKSETPTFVAKRAQQGL